MASTTSDDGEREALARALFWSEARPTRDEVGLRMWQRLCEATPHRTAWHEYADLVADELRRLGYVVTEPHEVADDDRA
jgi:hypothetical protein